ncbi:MAG TPA: hypothetical protein V6C46_09590 [Coleofasciculaceae cyanobacterium]
MIPKFQDLATWQQADQLMQPAYIRLIDILRQTLERSTWEGRYEEVPLWPAGVSEETKHQITQLQDQLATAGPEAAMAIEQTLAALPQPFPAYYLHLSQGDRTVTVDLWSLCDQVCFLNFLASHRESDQEAITVQVDDSLFDSSGALDWQRIDTKAQGVVQQIFNALP